MSYNTLDNEYNEKWGGGVLNKLKVDGSTNDCLLAPILEK